MRVFQNIKDYIRKSLYTTKGDLAKHNGTTVVRFPVGTPYQVLRSNGVGDDLEYSANDVMVTQTGQALLYRLIDIGDWDMLTNVAKSVAHGVSSQENILSVSGTIRDDLGNATYEIGKHCQANGAQQLGIASIDDTNVNLYTVSTGFFDTSAFDSTSYNRGRLIITYSTTAIA